MDVNDYYKVIVITGKFLNYSGPG